MRTISSTTRRTAATVVAAAVVVGGSAAAARADGVERISFEPGATTAPVAGDVAAGDQDSYVFGASAGQRAVVHDEGPGGSQGDGYWTLAGPGGSPLHTGAGEEQEDVTVALPRTGDYDLEVHGATGGGYELDLTIPAPIAFAPGRTSRTLSGALSPSQGTDDAYSFRARAGQEAVVDLSSDTGLATWSLVAPGGTPLHTGTGEEQGHAVVDLPASGVYDLVVSTDAGPTGYDLTLTVPAG